MTRMADLDRAVREGHFAKKQLYSRDRLIAWSHSTRFEVGLEIVRRLQPRQLLDHGCGDGTFLALLMSEPDGPDGAVGSEVSHGLVADNQRRFAGVPNLDFVKSDSVDEPAFDQRFDAVICMEVLEHVVHLDLEIARMKRVLKIGGRLVVSVPVEIGIPLAVKQTYRRIAGWRGIGDYPGDSPYTLGQLLRGLTAGERQHFQRPIVQEEGFSYHTHKGFNWKRLRARLAEDFEVEEVFGSPVRRLPPALNSQAWIVARRV